MKKNTCILMVGLALTLAISTSQARIDQPSHIFYGNATLFGEPVDPGTSIDVRTADDGQLLVRYEIGRDPALGDQYALPIQMDDVDPRTPGRARPGDEVEIYIGNQLAAEPIVGAIGRAVRLDIDPQNLGTGPSIEIHDTEVLEGDTGITIAELDVTLNTTDERDIEIEWTTRDDTAVGGPACDEGIDYIEETGSLVIPAGHMEGVIEVSICGDERPQDDVTFFVDLIPESLEHGVLARSTATVTIIDDDDVPEIRVADGWINMPVSGDDEIVFDVSLSRNHDRTVSFSWNTVDGSAVAPRDYSADDGTVEIEPGQVSGEIRVTVHATDDNVAQKSFTLNLSDEDQGHLQRTTVAGIIANPEHDPSLRHEQDIVHGEDGVIGISNPTSVVVSPDGNQVYATSESSGQLTTFSRSRSSGLLSFVSTIDDSTEGFEDVALDSPVYVVASPDGENLYVAAKKANSIVVFSRGPDNGTLAHVENIAGGEGAIESLSGVSRLHVSDDGHHVYASGSNARAVAVFARDTGDGTLTFIEDTGSDDDRPPGMNHPAGLKLSPDGSQLFVTARHGDALVVFDRDNDMESEDFGRLSHRESLQNGLGGVTGLDGAIDVTVDAGGENLYIIAENDQMLTRALRDDEGEIILDETWQQGEDNLPGMGGAQHLQITPDNLEIFVTGFDDHSLTVFRRGNDGLDGQLQVRETLFNNQGNLTNMAGPTDMAVSPNNRHLYVVANESNAIVVFTRMAIDPLFSDRFMSPVD